MSPWLVVFAAIGGVLVGWWLRGEKPQPELYEPLSVIRYSLATVCMNCEMVTESRNDHCVHCGAPGYCLINLSTRRLIPILEPWVNR